MIKFVLWVCVVVKFPAAATQPEFKLNVRVNSIKNDNIHLYLILTASRSFDNLKILNKINEF